ncbi:hypothetical protein BGX38DRAFT_1261117 [Terfezia claveryi]|nr:hypothetical protein BGX38DRAFT_1261117 [Terfezia claveryi]
MACFRDITWLPRLTPNPFHDTERNSHTTNPAGISRSKAPVNASGQVVTSLRNRYHFPSAANLPHDDDIDKNYFGWDRNAGSFRPKKHWAYFGEITDMKRVARLNLVTRDIAGNSVPVWFHFEHYGLGRPKWMGDWKWEQGDPAGTITEAQADGVTLKVGHTLVIVYPELRDFEDKNETCGLRIDGDERPTFKVLPYSLDELLVANDIIVSQRLPSFTPACYHCKESTSGTPTLFCAKCRTAHYCNKDCQTNDWASTSNGSSTTKSHKYLCRLYREVKWFTDINWDSYIFRKGIRFSR